MPIDPLYIDVGRLRERVSIQQLTQGTDQATGLPAEQWTEFANPYAYFDMISAMETFQAPQYEKAVTQKVTMRYLPGVTSAMRVLYLSQVYEIEGAVDVQMRRVKLLLYVMLRNEGPQ